MDNSMNDFVIESGSPLSKKGSKWRVVVARPGVGSSGTYTEDVLKTYGPVAVPPGTKSWFSHSKREDPRDQVGTFDEGAFWDDAEKALVADLTVKKHWVPIVNEIGTDAEASIRVRGKKDGHDNVIELIPDRANSVDLVGYAGLEGSGLLYQVEQLLEQARLAYEPDAEASAQRKDNAMEKMIEELKASVDALKADFVAFVAESRAELKGEADAEAVEAAANAKLAEALTGYLEQETAIAEAKLSPIQEKALKAKALAGDDITEALAEAKAVAEELRESATTTTETVIVGGAATIDNSKYTIPSWRS